MTSAQTHYQNGELAAAVAAVVEELRHQPGHTGKRAFLAELLCLQGEFERADRQLDTLLSLAPDTLLTVGTWRQLIRAAQARREVFDQGRAPEVIEQPTQYISRQLEILLAAREGDAARAARLVQEQEDERRPLAARVDGKGVDDVRDLDDACAGVLEVLAANGKYFWVDFEQIDALEFAPAERPLDLLWRKARLNLRSGTEGEVFVPMIYPATPGDELEMLGRRTDWQEINGLVRGRGQRTWLVGEAGTSLGELCELAFEPLTVAQ